MADHQQPQQRESNAIHADGLNLPPGFCFHPTDNEIVSHYLTNKVHNKDYTCTAIEEVDLNKTEPWDLPDKAKFGEKEWYFFNQKERNYPTGLRVNRATEASYWKATGKDKEVYNTTKAMVRLVGMKKTLVFYKGRAPRGDKTNWVMHEYRLGGSDRLPSLASASSLAANAVVAMKASCSTSKDEWVVCRIFVKTTAPAMASAQIDQNHNIVAIPIPIPMPLPALMPIQFPILPDFAMDPVPPYYPNAGVWMPLMIPPMAGIGGAGGHLINDALFGNPMAAPPPMNFYHEMGMGAAAGQMDMEVAGAGAFDVAASESRSSSMVSQKDEQANVVEFSSMMSVTGPGSVTTSIEMDGIWKYNY